MMDSSRQGDDEQDRDEFLLEDALREAFRPRTTSDQQTTEMRAADLGSKIFLKDPEEEDGVLTKGDGEQSLDPESRYELHGEVARGGMGIVYKARDAELGREVAIKVLRHEHRQSTEILQRFVDEAQIGGQLQHPGVVPVYDLALDAAQRPYFTMKYVRGMTLAARLQEREDLETDRQHLLQVFAQICQTMAYTHARGVVHRDLKPSNIMLGKFGEVQLMDWGLSKVQRSGGTADEISPQVSSIPKLETTRSGSQSGSIAGSVFGTLSYMAPEQARGEIHEVDERSDVFSLGAILCEILTGEPPYVADDILTLKKMAQACALEAAEKRLTTAVHDEDLLQIVRRCLSKEKSNRYRNAGKLGVDLQRYLSSTQERLHKAELDRASADARAKSERRARHLTLALACSVVFILIAGGSSLAYLKQDRDMRLMRTEEAISQSLEDAALLEGVAKQAKTVESWDLAIAASKHANSLLDQGEVPKTTVARVKQLHERLNASRSLAIAQAAQEKRDHELLVEVDHIRAAVYAHEPGTMLAAKILSAFKSYGHDLEKLEAEAGAARIRESSIRLELITLLDELAFLLYKEDEVSLPLEKVIRIARLADPDPVRHRFRDALQSRDGKILLEVANDPALLEREPETIGLVAYVVGRLVGGERAVSLFRKATKKHPSDFWLHFYLSHFIGYHCRKPDLEDALAEARIALALRPSSDAAWILYAASLSNRRDDRLPEAIEALKKAIQIRPANARAQINLGYSYYYTGKPHKAISCYKTAISLLDEGIHSHKRSAAIAHFNLAMAQADVRKFEEAEGSYKKAINLYAHDPSYYTNYANLLTDLHRQEEAILLAEKVVKMRPNRPNSYNNLGFHLMRAGRLEDAMEPLKRAIEINPKHSSAHMNLGLVYADLKRNEEAIVELKASLSGCQNPGEVEHYLGYVYSALDDDIESCRHYEKSLEHRPRAVGTLENLAYVQLNHGRFVQARRRFKEALEIRPKKISILHGAARAHHSLGDIGTALGDLAAILLINARSMPAANYQAYLLRATGNAQDAEVGIRKALGNRENPGACKELGFLCMTSGRFDLALEHFRAGERLLKSHHSYWAWKTWIGEVEQMKALLADQGLARDYDSRALLARALEYTGKPEDAVTVWMSNFAQSDPETHHLFWAARAALASAKHENALAWLQARMAKLRSDVKSAKDLVARLSFLEDLGEIKAHKLIQAMNGPSMMRTLPSDQARAWKELLTAVDQTIAGIRGDK